jgi:hypothetical protein
MTSNPKEPPLLKFGAFAEWLRKHPLAAVGFSGACLGLSLGVVAFLASPPYPAISPSNTFQVWEYDLGVLSGGTREPVKNHKLTLSFKAPAYVNDDIPVVATISDVEGFQFNVNVRIELETNGLDFTPKSGKDVSLKNGAEAEFFVKSNSPGIRLLRAHDRLWLAEAPGIFENPGPTSTIDAIRPDTRPDNDSDKLSILFVEKPMFWVLDRQTVNDLKTLSAIVGIPGLILFVLGLLKGRAISSEPEPARHVIRSTEGHRKSKKSDR